MAQQYDVALKLLFRRSGEGIVRALTGAIVTAWLDKDLPEIRNTRADMLGKPPKARLSIWNS